MKFVKGLMAAALLSTAIAGSAFAAAPLDETQDTTNSLTRYGFSSKNDRLVIDQAAVDAFHAGINPSVGKAPVVKAQKEFLSDIYGALITTEPSVNDEASLKAFIARKGDGFAIDITGVNFKDPDQVNDAKAKALEAVKKFLVLKHPDVLAAEEHELTGLKSAGGREYGHGKLPFHPDADLSGYRSAKGTRTGKQVLEDAQKRLDDLFGPGKDFDGLGGATLAQQKRMASAIEAYTATHAKVNFTSDKDVDAKVVTVPGALDKVVERAVAANEDDFLKIVAGKSAKAKQAQDYLDMVDQVIAGTTGFDAVTTPEEFSKAIDGLEAQVIKLKGELKKATDAAVAAPKPAAKPADVGVPAVAPAAPKAMSKPASNHALDNVAQPADGGLL